MKAGDGGEFDEWEAEAADEVIDGVIETWLTGADAFSVGLPFLSK